MSHKVIHGDCREVMAGMDAESIHAVVTSPPYDNLRTYEGTCDWNRSVWEGVFDEMYRVLVPGGIAVWVVGDATVNGSETGTSFAQAIYAKSVGFNIHDTMIWNKGAFTATGSLRVRYASVFEYMFVFSKGKPRVFNPIRDRKTKHEGKTVSQSSVRQSDGSMKKHSPFKPIPKYSQRYNIWNQTAARGSDRAGHPAPMPISIARDHIISWTNPGDIVLDPFAGGGTTGVACVETDRNFVGIEKVAEYIEIARARIASA
jgi:DNA modification methylase